MATTTDKRNAARTWRDWHGIYESWPTEPRASIDNAYRALCEVLADDGFALPNDDAAEQLIGEIVRFAQSRKSDPEAPAGK